MPNHVNYETFIHTLSDLQIGCLQHLKTLITEEFPEVKWTLLSNQPYFYLEQFEHINLHRRPSIVMAFYQDHVNIFTMSNLNHKANLSMYTFTSKNTLQIFYDQVIEEQPLKILFKDALTGV
ncbi:hypothetical protein [Paracholeplasma manati]|uniref:YdhG-like domain-containing protein n=1 Tax=Paracholeplasma manati TaxID=591373 RepID=A0ABT2Y8K6_9MOLU|nr:hypothetical protein [Paracholeplasma manati]MCV2232847.1 hypothetical protein [Paracholeplasma manati]MDG0889604.1 hypothetical protein [Paracholeplasma manati]